MFLDHESFNNDDQSYWFYLNADATDMLIRYDTSHSSKKKIIKKLLNGKIGMICFQKSDIRVKT